MNKAINTVNTVKSLIKPLIISWLQPSKKLRQGLLVAFSQALPVWLVLLALTLPSSISASLTSSGLMSPHLSNSNVIAYSVDYEMDKARAEKTVEHYGEPIRDIVEGALENNEENPDSKSTAQNTYQRENPLNEILPKKIGDSFSQKELSDMQRDDQSANR